MFCTQCGTRMDDEARFCTACGKPAAHPPVDDFSASEPRGFATNEPRFDRGRQYAETVPPQSFPGSAPPMADSAWTTAAQPRRRLRRIRAKKKIAGVCAGFAEYFDMDVTLMRLIWVGLLLIPPHVGLIAYIVAWAVLPKS